MIIHITRHGQVDPPALAKGEDPDYPRGDAPISDLGRTQARLLGQRLRELGFSGVIHSSPYRRTIETAHIISEIIDVAVVPSAPMREVVMSETQMDGFRGATIDELHSSFSRVDSAAHCFYPWWTSRVESPDDVEARVAPFVDQVAADGIDALLVGHGASTGGAIRHIMRHGTPDGLPHDDPGWNCALTSFRMPPNFTAIRLMDVSHLPGEWVTSNVRTRDQILAERGEEETE
ncbi:MAG TPA: histidine phosphatase family protein [Candidatus Latescibacteria bacterium]|nr:histidine phosphatase family protein [Candidatus Latescibacterota bacterium]